MKALRFYAGGFVGSLACLLLFTPMSLYAQRDLQDIPDPDPEIERNSFIVADGFEVNPRSDAQAQLVSGK
ncbi:MAG: hypothetical protein ABI614_15635 [Planctomycetota bacterium]